MGSHRTTIKRKRPLTHISTKGVKRREAIKSLHIELKASSSKTTVPLAVYQQASAKGQDIHRGGDSSKVVVQWLKGVSFQHPRVLEVGCLEVDNAIAKYVNSHHGSIRRIDLKSRDPRIEEQDFMTLDVPDEKYDLISLSLVLNFVPTPQGRYDMLLRTTQFLQTSEHMVQPALFVVLPLPCVENSRYLTSQHFLDIMESLGYSVSQSKETKRIAYWLFHWNGHVEEREWKKKVIKDGGGRNNFAISN